MTSYSIERPTRSRRDSRVRPGLVHLRAGEATIGQPVTIRKTDSEGNVLQEYPAVFLRSDRNGGLRCQEQEHGTSCTYRASEVFPRRETFRRWVAVFKQGGRPDDELTPVDVMARTEVEARYEALKRIREQYSERGNLRFTLHSVKREN